MDVTVNVAIPTVSGSGNRGRLRAAPRICGDAYAKRLIELDPAYVRELGKVDHNVLSTLPKQGKDNRPFLGVVVVRENRQYCVPLSSPKPKHEHISPSETSPRL